jgi:3-oxoacyl-[acyl-carrier-protein] synthase III
MQFNKTRISGSGIYLPEKILSNFDLEKMVDTNDEWIFERTGISERRICSTEGGEFPTDMALKASTDALNEAGLEPNDIDMILFATVTPDMKLPNSASILQTKLGITNKCAAVDLAAACSGVVYSLNMANALIQTGACKHILIVGSEMLSREVNWKDRNICILFGDGCGAMVVSQNTTDEDSEFYATCMHADGTGKDFFNQPIGGAITPITREHLDNDEHYMKMKGGEMFKVATRTLAGNAKEVIGQTQYTLEDVDWLVPHQANIRIIETTGKLLGIAPEKVVINIQKYGNTSAATIPIAFHEAIKEGKIKRGDLVLFDAFGAGLTSGATLFRY